MALWCHSDGAWNNGLILMRASNGNSWADVSNHMTPLWQAGDMEILNAGSRASYGRYHGLEIPNNRIKVCILSWWFKMLYK